MKLTATVDGVSPISTYDLNAFVSASAICAMLSEVNCTHDVQERIVGKLLTIVIAVH